MELISLVIPTYNEAANIASLLAQISEVENIAQVNFEIIFVLDPCSDNTEDIILNQMKTDLRIKLIKMSRRFGQANCTIAGIKNCTGAGCVVIDADMQDPPKVIVQMISKFRDGFDVVYGRRIAREGETLLKRFISYVGYWVIDRISEVPIPRNTGDFRLISRRVINELLLFNEHDAFLRGLIGYIGFRQTFVDFKREQRLTGSGKYNQFTGSLWIGFNGIFNFSKYPLHLISILGISISGISFLLGFIYIILKICNYSILWGNPTLVILISFLSGVQILSLGIIAQYFARIFNEMKGRPPYIIDSKKGF